MGLVSGTSVSPANYAQPIVERQLSQYQRYGITTMISLGMNKDALYLVIQQQKETGTVTTGKYADLLVLDADPISDIANTKTIAMVFHRGRKINRE